MAGRMLELALSIKGKIDKTIPDSLRQASASVQELERRMTSLKGASNGISTFEKQAATVRRLSQEFRQAQTAVQTAAQAMRQTGGATHETQAVYSAAQERVRAFSQALETERTKLHQTSTALQEAGVNTSQLASEQKKLQDAMEATSKVQMARGNLDIARKNRDNASKKLSDATMGFYGGFDMVRTINAPIVEATKAAMDFEEAMSDVRKVVDFDTPQQFKEMGDDILQLSQRLPMASEDIAKIVAAGGKAGIARGDLMAFAESAFKMGVAFDVTADQAGDMMAKWRTAFKMNQTDVVALADKINYLGNTTAASAPKISDVVTRIGPLGEIGGVASGEIAALGASMVGTGVESDVAATGIKNLSLGMTAGEGATKSQVAAFQALGLDAADMAKRMQTDAKGAILDVMKALQKLPAEAQASTLSDLFGKESIGAIAPLLSNLGALEENFGKVADASKYAGSMEQEYAAKSATTKNKIQLLKNTLSAVGITVGNTVLPVIGILADKLAPIAMAVGEWAQKNQTLVGILVAVVGAISGVVLGILAISVAAAVSGFVNAQLGVASAALKLYRIGLMATAAAQKVFSASAMVSFGGAKTAVLSFGASAKSVFAQMAALSWTQVGTGMKTGIASGASGAMAAVRSFVSSAGTALRSFVTSAGALLKALSFANLASVLRSGVSAFISFGVRAAGALRLVGTAISVVARAGLAFAFSPIGIALIAIAGAAYLIYTNWSKIGPLFMQIGTTIQTAFTNAWTMLQPALAALSAAFMNLVNTVGPALMTAWQTITAAIAANSGIFTMLGNILLFVAQVLGGVLLGAIILVADVLAGAITAAVEVVSAVLAGLINILARVINFITSVFAGDWEAAWQSIVSIFSAAFDMIAGIAQGVLDGIMSTVNNIISSIKSIASFGGGTDVSENARGGIYRKGAFLTTFAEDSAEAAIPLDGSA